MSTLQLLRLHSSYRGIRAVVLLIGVVGYGTAALFLLAGLAGAGTRPVWVTGAAILLAAVSAVVTRALTDAYNLFADIADGVVALVQGQEASLRLMTEMRYEADADRDRADRARSPHVAPPPPR